MKLIVVGGAWTACGKTSVVELLVKAFPGWGALKITPSRPDEPCPTGGDCGACQPPAGGHEWVSDPVRLAEPGKDTARFLAAGAAKVGWLRSLPELLPGALEAALAEFAGLPGVILESTTAMPRVEGLRILVVRQDSVLLKDSARVALASVDILAFNLGAHEALKGEPSLRTSCPQARWLPVSPSVPHDHPRNAAFIVACRAGEPEGSWLIR